MGVTGALHAVRAVVTQRPLRPGGPRGDVRHLAGRRLAAPVWGRARSRNGGRGRRRPGAARAATLLAVNLSGAAGRARQGPHGHGLRFALAGFIATACLRRHLRGRPARELVDLSGHVVLAHAVIGLFAWLGLTYVAAAEKLLADVLPGPRARPARGRPPGGMADPRGHAALCPGCWPARRWPGLEPSSSPRAWPRTWRRSPPTSGTGAASDLRLIFVTTAAGFLIAGAGLALAAAVVMPRDDHEGMALAAAACDRSRAWPLAALTGHARKVVPFILWSVLRGRGIATGPSGRPLGFGDLYDHRIAAGSYALVTAGIAAACAGFAATQPAALAAGLPRGRGPPACRGRGADDLPGRRGARGHGGHGRGDDRRARHPVGTRRAGRHPHRWHGGRRAGAADRRAVHGARGQGERCAAARPARRQVRGPGRVADADARPRRA